MRLACLATAMALLVPNWPQDWTALAVPALSPYTAIVSSVATRSLAIATIVAAPLLLVVLFRRRWLCHYVCPTGLLAELAGRCRGRGAVRATRLPPLGQWLAVLTLGGAVLGYPLFLWLDPLAIFTAFRNAWGRELGYGVSLGALLLPLVLLISLIRPGLWCARLCPLGGTQELLAWPWRWCRSGVAGAPAAQRGWPLARRVVLGAGLGALGGAVILRWVSGPRAKPLRPPGAGDEKRFTGLCQRCGNCARVCPSRIIHPDVGEHGADSFLTPLVRFDKQYCLETCQRCTHVCPSGALRRLTAEQKPRAVIGRPKVDMAICLLGDDRECSICRRACPYDAIKIVFSEEDYLSTPTVDPQRCNGCGACQVMCPTEPRKAIVVQATQPAEA
jgi:ferredoxin-type protein NapF